MKKYRNLSFQEIDAIKDSYDYARSDFLTRNKWKRSCDNPISVWLWEKTINYRRVMVDIETAYAIQRSISYAEEKEISK